jgi:hypothetical protein
MPNNKTSSQETNSILSFIAELGRAKINLAAASQTLA